jgi:hypothetical protein
MVHSFVNADFAGVAGKRAIPTKNVAGCWRYQDRTTHLPIDYYTWGANFVKGKAEKNLLW